MNAYSHTIIMCDIQTFFRYRVSYILFILNPCIHSNLFNSAVDKDKTLEEEDEWYTADEGTFDEHGKLSWSPGYLEKIEEEEKMNKEKKRTDSDSTTEGDEVKSATKLQLQFEIEEVCVCNVM